MIYRFGKLGRGARADGISHPCSIRVTYPHILRYSCKFCI